MNSHSLLLLLTVIVTCTTAFQLKRQLSRPVSALRAQHPKKHDAAWTSTTAAATTIATTLVIPTAAVHAVDGSYGFLEGVPAGLIHPVLEFLLYGVSVAAALQGIKWRSVRTLLEQINSLKAAGGAEDEIKRLQEKRSVLMQGGHRDKHVSLGSVILGTGVFLSMEGGLSTYWRTGELFFGDHLIYGMALTAFWCVSYALTPGMQSGNIAAKNAHFALNAIGMLFFTYQIGTGLEITGNVIAQTPGW